MNSHQRFDPIALSYIESAIADYLPVGAYAVPAITTENSVYIAATSLKGPALASDGTLATVTFEVLTTNTSTIRLMDVTLANSAGLPLEVVTTDAQIVVPQYLPWDVAARHPEDLCEHFIAIAVRNKLVIWVMLRNAIYNWIHWHLHGGVVCLYRYV